MAINAAVNAITIAAVNAITIAIAKSHLRKDGT
jgi:hypothetical protein